VEYAFLANFDLLQDSRQDVHDRLWTNPACHVVIDHHFKLEHVHEEIQPLNVEIHHVVTYIRDEDALFCLKETEIMQVNPGLAYQVKIYRMEWGHFNTWHMDCFRKLAALPEFTGSIIPRTSTVLHSGVDNAMVVGNATDDPRVDGEAQGNEDDKADQEDDEDDQADEDIQAMVSVLMSLTIDAPGVV